MSSYDLSADGEEALVDEEGEVLKAYRCPAGAWTIGIGLTDASGVVKVKPGMVISKAESRRLLKLAIARNYAPRVRKAVDLSVVPHAQAAFDGSVSFDFNTGKIDRASWVARFNAGNFIGARSSLMSWVKGGGRVLPGLKRRRRNEAGMIFDGVYPASVKRHASVDILSGDAVFVVPMDKEERAKVRNELLRLGYEVGGKPDAIRAKAVRAFQEAHDLTSDGKIGRATLSTLQREVDARTHTQGTGAAAVSGGATAGGGEVMQPTGTTGTDGSGLSADLVAIIGWSILFAATLYGLYLAWTYRDVIASRIAKPLPRLAAFLRSF